MRGYRTVNHQETGYKWEIILQRPFLPMGVHPCIEKLEEDGVGQRED